MSDINFSPIEAIGCRWIDLVCVIQLFPQGLYDQADEAIGGGIRDQTFVEANRVMHARYRNRAGYADKSPNVAHALAGRWEGRCGKKCPKPATRKPTIAHIEIRYFMTTHRRA